VLLQPLQGQQARKVFKAYKVMQGQLARKVFRAYKAFKVT
jgi:hypothetical protein